MPLGLDEMTDVFESQDSVKHKTHCNPLSKLVQDGIKIFKR